MANVVRREHTVVTYEMTLNALERRDLIRALNHQLETLYPDRTVPEESRMGAMLQVLREAGQ